MENETGTEHIGADERITRLHDVAAEFQHASSKAEVFDLIIDAAVEILGFSWCSVAVPVEGRFELTRVSESAPFEEGERTLQVDEGIAGKTYQEGESVIIRDETEHDEAKPADQSIRSGLSIPLGEWGILQGISSEPDAFDENDREVAELLAAHATATLNRLEQEYELKRKNERLEEFASIVSHDLRNPLDVLQGRLNHVRTQYDDKHIDAAFKSSKRMETLIDDLLSLALAGKTVSAFEAMELSVIVESCWETVDTQNATLANETALTIRGDTNRVQELLANLVRNAMEHATPSGDGSDLTITIGDLPNADGFYVEDDGRGIPDDIRDDIFESGFSTAGEGTGLGLGIVDQIVTAHDWEIVATAGTDGGARFEITDVDIVE